MEWLQQREHALGVVEGPAHVGVGHQVDAVADDLADGADELDILLHACGAVDRSPAEAELHRLVALVLVALGFDAEFVERHGVEAAGVDGDTLLGAAAEQAVDGLLRVFAEEVPEGDVDGGDGGHGDALAAEGHGAAIHLLPEDTRCPRDLRRGAAA